MSKMVEIRKNNVAFSNDDTDLDYVNSNFVRLVGDDMDINTIDLNDINLDDNDDDLKTMIHVRIVAWCNEYKQRKQLTES